LLSNKQKRRNTTRKHVNITKKHHKKHHKKAAKKAAKKAVVHAKKAAAAVKKAKAALKKGDVKAATKLFAKADAHKKIAAKQVKKAKQQKKKARKAKVPKIKTSPPVKIVSAPKNPPVRRTIPTGKKATATNVNVKPVGQPPQPFTQPQPKPSPKPVKQSGIVNARRNQPKSTSHKKVNSHIVSSQGRNIAGSHVNITATSHPVSLGKPAEQPTPKPHVKIGKTRSHLKPVFRKPVSSSIQSGNSTVV